MNHHEKESEFEPQHGATPSKAKSPKQRKFTRHGILSRHPLEALVKAGYDVRVLRRFKAELREELQPQGPLGELVFDNFFTYWLRRVLIAHVEGKIFAEQDKTLDDQVKEAGLFAMVGSKPPKRGNSGPGGLAAELSALVRYDAHTLREMFRSVGILFALRMGGHGAVAQLLVKRFAHAQREDEAAPDPEEET